MLYITRLKLPDWPHPPVQNWKLALHRRLYHHSVGVLEQASRLAIAIRGDEDTKRVPVISEES